MLPINNWQVAPSPQNPYLLWLNADNNVFNMTPDQARKIAAALIEIADKVEASSDEEAAALWNDIQEQQK